MNNFGQYQYMKTDITTADQAKLIVLLYEGAINFLNKAKDSIREGNVEGKCNNINRAQDIIHELSYSLEMKKGGEIAEKLWSLYQFMERHLVKAKVERDGTKKIDEIVSMLSKLNEAWSEILNRPEVKSVRQVKTPMSPGLSQGINV